MKPIYRNLPKNHPYYEPRHIVIKCPESQENDTDGQPAGEPENANTSNGVTLAATAGYSSINTNQHQPKHRLIAKPFTVIYKTRRHFRPGTIMLKCPEFLVSVFIGKHGIATSNQQPVTSNQQQAISAEPSGFNEYQYQPKYG
jgi:hypothetical protein